MKTKLDDPEESSFASTTKSKGKFKVKMSEISKSLHAESKDDQTTELDKYNETYIVRKKHETRSNLAKRQTASK